jgi:hypothetical protein
LNYLRTGQTDEAVQELILARTQPQYHDYTTEFAQDDEEVYRAAGYSEAETKTMASYALVLAHLPELKLLSYDLMDLFDSYRQGGDTGSAQAVLQITAQLGERVASAPGDALVTQLAGISLQGMALSRMDPEMVDDVSGEMVKERLSRLTQHRAEITQLAKQMAIVQDVVTHQDWINYKDRWRVFGEEAALRWLVGKYSR